MIFLGSFCFYDPFYYYFSSKFILVYPPLISPNQALPVSEKALLGPGRGPAGWHRGWGLQSPASSLGRHRTWYSHARFTITRQSPALCFCDLKSQQSPSWCSSLQATALLQAQAGLIYSAPTGMCKQYYITGTPAGPDAGWVVGRPWRGKFELGRPSGSSAWRHSQQWGDFTPNPGHKRTGSTNHQHGLPGAEQMQTLPGSPTPASGAAWREGACLPTGSPSPRSWTDLALGAADTTSTAWYTRIQKSTTQTTSRHTQKRNYGRQKPLNSSLASETPP